MAKKSREVPVEESFSHFPLLIKKPIDGEKPKILQGRKLNLSSESRKPRKAGDTLPFLPLQEDPSRVSMAKAMFKSTIWNVETPRKRTNSYG